jgi:uncharacterized protein YegL
MAENDFNAELPVNYEQKCACVLVLDTSGSMTGSPIDELNKGLIQFKNEIKDNIAASNRLEVAIVTFNSNVKVVSNFKIIHEWAPPQLSAQGSTKMADGVKRAIQVLETRKEWYKQTGQKYYRPYIILITDGAPDYDQNMEDLKKTINDGVNTKNFNFWAFGVQNADMDVLKNISHSSFQPLKLKGVEFGKFFKWLSNSMAAVSNSTEGDKLDLKPKSDDENFLEGFQITV